MSNKHQPSYNHNQQQLMRQQVTHQEISMGPLPPASEMRQYKDILESAPERIIKMAENQSLHRQKLEKRIVFHGVMQSWAGLIIGFLVAIGCIATSVYLAIINQVVVASILGGSTVIGLVTVFITGNIIGKNKSE